MRPKLDEWLPNPHPNSNPNFLTEPEPEPEPEPKPFGPNYELKFGFGACLMVGEVEGRIITRVRWDCPDPYPVGSGIKIPTFLPTGRDRDGYRC